MSKFQLQLVLSILFIFLGVNESFSKEWRGIVPLHSTREDVIRLLNQCKNSNPSCEFTLPDEFIHLEFSGDAKLHNCSPGLKRDTVLLIEVFPTRPLSLKKSGFNKRDFKTVDVSDSTKNYLDEQNGIVLKVEKSKVIQVDFIPILAERDLCSSYYENPVAFVQWPSDLHVPVIYLSCPSKRTPAGEPIELSADIAGTPKITFLWTLTRGKIISGQGTRVIKVDTTGLSGQTIVATAKLGRFQSSCEFRLDAK